MSAWTPQGFVNPPCPITAVGSSLSLNESAALVYSPVRQEQIVADETYQDTVDEPSSEEFSALESLVNTIHEKQVQVERCVSVLKRECSFVFPRRQGCSGCRNARPTCVSRTV